MDVGPPGVTGDCESHNTGPGNLTPVASKAKSILNQGAASPASRVDLCISFLLLSFLTSFPECMKMLEFYPNPLIYSQIHSRLFREILF